MERNKPTKQINKDVRYLTEDWICPEIIDRQEIKKDLDNALISRLIGEKSVPRAIFAYGGTGSGKTFIIRKTIEDNLEDIKKHIPTFEYVYINLQREAVPSYFSALFKINMQLEKYLPLHLHTFGFIEKIPTRGWGTQLQFEFIKELVKLKKLCLVIVIDEVDRLIAFEKKYEFLFAFSTLYEEYKDEFFTGVCPIFISNKINLLKNAPTDLPSRIPHKLHFKPYGMSELYKILETTAKYALETGTYTQELLEQVAREINDGTKSAREAKLLLYHTLIEKNSEKAREKTDMDLVSEELKTYSFHQKLALLSVLKKHKELERMSKSMNKRFYKGQFPTVMSIWEIYKKTCENSEETPKGYRQFHRLLEPMIKNGILSTERKSHGSTRGMANLLYLGEDYEIIAPIILEGMKGI